MKLVKSFLFGAIVSCIAFATVRAADLPVSKAAPVEYVRICSAHGAGFFYIPGSDICLKISGRIRADYYYAQPENGYFYSFDENNDLAAFGRQGRYEDAIGYLARASIDTDARTNTDYGLLRAHITLEIDRFAGQQGTGPGGTFVNKAYIQWAGITAGFVQSFFDFFASDVNWGSFGGSPGSDLTTNVLAYTATLGSGFISTLSLEDRNARQLNPNGFTYLDAFLSTYDTAGQRMPDVVGVLRVDQDWGSAQLSGATHQLNSGAIFNPFGTVLYPFKRHIDTTLGWAVQGGVQFNMPFLAAGDVLWLQAAYADGALSYLGLGPNTTVGTTQVFAADGVIVDGDIKTSTGWNVTAAGVHYWTPRLRSTLWGSYTAVDYDRAIRQTYEALRDFNIVQVGSALIWSPVSKFDIGMEVLYGRADRKRSYVDFAISNIFNNALLVKHSEDTIQTRLRLQRDF